ncbi:neutral protease [Sodiomyces alkalinus F11]|uniref:Neutral protease 2 n=1 Tax=Sodiomyces alkalinus (strain CBS 110278 / VKM F-3762 / F11) TaxID=1314773 RepID=A0A3N2PRC7_SODAK|nr:neutral protease [Sodiomyces alkalinus F11]ROT37072.1 neutral protease [Sodiomyces alkalinus F11]
MRLIAGVTALVGLVTAASVDLSRRETPLEVKLDHAGNSVIHASLTNNGDEALKLFTTGTFLDDRAVEKVEVYSGNTKLPFDGLRLTVSTVNLPEDAFRVINAGETIEVDFDAAELHDLSSGGDYGIQTKGAFSYAALNSTEVVGVVPYSSNTLHSTIDGSHAASVHKEFQAKAKRTIVQGDCQGYQRTATETAIRNCQPHAVRARWAAQNNPAKLQEYFKSTSAHVKNTVTAVFDRVAYQCGSTNSGDTRYYCSDVYRACSGGAIAYALPSQNFIVNCPTFFTLPAYSYQCHAQDQQSTVVHEMTHLYKVAATADYGCYGYNCVRALSAAQNLNHADTYSLFAQSLFAGC